MSANIQPVRGMNDILPGKTELWAHVESVLKDVLARYGYHEIRLPIVEKTALFSRSIGEVTDIVEKEMYTFEDRSGDSLTLRPEGTAGCVRAGISNGLLHNQIQRLWYMGPMFRHERPQKGRYRQFHQIGVEAFGLAGPDVDAEIILLTAAMWKALGVTSVSLELNSLGTPEARAAYRERLVEYFNAHRDALDADSLRRLESNPLRILDSKNPDLQELIADAPSLLDHLDAESQAHFDALRGMLDDCGVAYTVNSRLVRGLDYYSRTVFEWVTDRLGAQSAVCSGGRYDGLVELLGGSPTPAIGWGMGLERLIALIEEEGREPDLAPPHAYLLAAGDAAGAPAIQLGEKLRAAVPALRLVVNCGGGSFKSQMKKADRSGAEIALIVGDDELRDNTVSCKPLRGGEQQTLAFDALIDKLNTLVAPRA